MPDNLTLIETSALSKKIVDQTIYKGFFEGQLPNPIDTLPIKTVGDFTFKTIRLTRTGRPTTRKIGGSAGTYKIAHSDRDESITVIQDAILLDVEQEEPSNYVVDPVDANLMQWGEDLKRLHVSLWLNGLLTGNDTEPMGLRYRLATDAMFAGQAVDAGNLDVDSSDDNRQTWLDHMNSALRLCAGGKADSIWMNAQTYLKWESTLRRLKLLDTTKDQYDRVLSQFKGIPFYDVGMEPESALFSDATGQIIGDDAETSIFGDASTTPIFFVHTSSERAGCKMTQVHGLKTKKLGQSHEDTAKIVVDARSTQGNFFPGRYSISAVVGLNIT